MFQFYQLAKTEDVDNEETISEEPVTYNESESINDSIKSEHNIKTVKTKDKKVRFVEPLKENSINTNGIEKYGNPNNIFDENGSRILFWKFVQPNPWSTLYFNQTKNTFTYGLKHSISKKLLNEWSKIIPNLGFNDSEKNIMITTSDEVSALAVINLVLNTINDELTIKEIIDSNLINISVSKIKAHPLVKTKILEQINEKILINKEIIKPDDGMDLATNKLDIGAYGGNEFSFL